MISAVTVQHGLTLGSGSALLVIVGYPPPSYTGTPVSGALTVQGPLSVGSDAYLGFTYDGFSTITAPPVTVNGPVTVGSNALLGTLASQVRGPLRAMNASSVVMYSTTIAGPVSIAGGGGANDPEEAFIGSGFSGEGVYQEVNLVWNTISGPVSVTGWTGGEDGEFSVFVAENTTGPMTLSGNAAPSPATEASVGSSENVINGPATATGNSPAPINLGNSTVNGPIKGDQGYLYVS